MGGIWDYSKRVARTLFAAIKNAPRSQSGLIADSRII